MQKQQPKIGERLTYSVDEAAVLLGVSRSLAYECIQRGEIPSIRFGRRVLVPRVAIEVLLGHGLNGNLPTKAR